MLIKLSPHFSLDEFLVSEVAGRFGINNREISERAIQSLQRLCSSVLEPVRDIFMVPIVVSSGYRCAALNAAIGSKDTSQHLIGEAADITIPGWSPIEAAKRIIAAGIPYDQLIHEYGEWLHLSYSSSRDQRGQVLTIDRFGTRTGLHPVRLAA